MDLTKEQKPIIFDESHLTSGSPWPGKEGPKA